MIEIERKFLVLSDAFKSISVTQNQIAQGYLNSDPERTVRVRIKNNQGFITIKGKSNESGLSRLEWEKEIDVAEATQLLALCEKGVIHKTRYEVPFGQHVVEVDVFGGDNEGLVMAEIELSSETETYAVPEWLGEEVTNDARYYNSYLSQNPYTLW
ncbi:MAG: CYTH domain-containing protein [Flavobacterium sp.]|nr:CYTH domain-containing protein [Flavobacterium sp.]MBP6099251.1 CYTH domain-containing protein [Flavobacterium sp.]